MEEKLKIKWVKKIEKDREKLVFIRGVGNKCRVDEARCVEIAPGTWAAVLTTGATYNFML